MIVKVKVTNVFAIVRDSKSNSPVGINKYLLPGKYSKSDVKEMFDNGIYLGSNAPDPTLGTNQIVDKVTTCTLEIAVSEKDLLNITGFTTGIVSGDWTPVPFEEEKNEQ